MARQYYKLSELIAAIKAYTPPDATTGVEPAMHARIRIGGSASHLAQTFQDKSDAGQRYFLDKLETAATAEQDPHRQLLFHNVLMRMDFSYQRFLKAANALKHTPLSTVEAHATWYALYVHRFTRMQSFNPSQWQKSGYLLRALYPAIIAQFKAQFAALLDRSEPNPSAGERILISVTEFMEKEHPLTRCVIDLADALIEHSGAQVMIVNAATPPRLPVSYFGDHTFASIIEDFNGVNTISYGTSTIAFAQNRNLLLNRAAFEWYGAIMQAFRPTGVISLGPGNVLADCFGASVPTLAYPNTGEVPLSLADGLCCVEKPAGAAMALLKRAGLKADHIHAIPTSHRLPASGPPATKQALGLPGSALAAVIVGMRLETECDPAFLSILEDAAKRHADLHFVFVGPLGRKAQFLARYPALSAKSRLLGMQEDVLAITRGCDLFINPFRQGGGTSALHALSAGLPVVTLGDGDVAKVCGQNFCSPDAIAFARDLDAVLEDGHIFQTRRDFGLKRWQEKSDLGAMVKALQSVFDSIGEQSQWRPTAPEDLPIAAAIN